MVSLQYFSSQEAQVRCKDSYSRLSTRCPYIEALTCYCFLLTSIHYLSMILSRNYVGNLIKTIVRFDTLMDNLIVKFNSVQFSELISIIVVWKVKGNHKYLYMSNKIVCKSVKKLYCWRHMTIINIFIHKCGYIYEAHEWALTPVLMF